MAFLANALSLSNPRIDGGPAWLALTYPYNWIMWILQICFYLIAGLGMRYKLGGWIGKVLYLPTFLVNSNLAALLGLYRYLSSKQTVVWKKAAR
jgi:hypothetical protein